MRRETVRITKRRLLLAASFGLTSNLLATATHAGNCGGGNTEYQPANYRVQSALPFVGYRYITGSNGVINATDSKMLSSQSASQKLRSPYTIAGEETPKLTTTDLSKETAL